MPKQDMMLVRRLVPSIAARFGKKRFVFAVHCLFLLSRTFFFFQRVEEQGDVEEARCRVPRRLQLMERVRLQQRRHSEAIPGDVQSLLDVLQVFVEPDGAQAARERVVAVKERAKHNSPNFWC
jgi:hypothetical protein